MKHFYRYLLSVVCSLFVLAACEEDNDEIVPMKNTDPIATVTSVVPTEGYVGNEFTVSGTDFGVRTEDIEVYIGSQKAEVVSCEDKAIVAKVPQGASSGKLSVIVYGQRIDTERVYTVLGVPGIHAVNPPYGFPGDEIALEGNDLISIASAYELMFASATEKAEIVGTPTAESLKVKVPASAASGVMNLTVSGKSVDLASYPFTVLKHAELEIPEEMLSGFAGSALTIKGRNLKQELLDKSAESGLPLLKVCFISENPDKEPVEVEVSAEHVTENTIDLDVPSDLAVDNYKISVVTPFERIEAQLSYRVLPIPVVTSVAPVKGYVGNLITISGENFASISSIDDVEVRFGEVPATEIRLDSEHDNALMVTVPAMTEFGEKTLSLSVQDIPVDMGVYEVFTLLESPVISSLKSNNAFSDKVVQAGSLVTVSGTGFKNGDILGASFGGQPVTLDVKSDTQITFTVPEACEAGESAVSLTFKGIAMEIVSVDKLDMLKAGSDVTEFVLKNYKHEFKVVEGSDARQEEWWMPQNWEVENVKADGKPVGVQYHNKKNEITSLAMQTDWGFPTTMKNGKIWQKTTLPKGSYKVFVEVRECNVTGSVHVVAAKGNNIPNTEDVATALTNVQITKEGLISTSTFKIDEPTPVSIGFVSTITKAKNYVKIAGFKIELSE